ncbi:MAG: hypothetical protein ACRC4W_00810, partial [Treponemataceae bacterium]
MSYFEKNTRPSTFCNRQRKQQGERYFKKMWLDAVSDKEIPVFRFAAKDDFTHEKDYKRSRQINAWFDEV